MYLLSLDVLWLLLFVNRVCCYGVVLVAMRVIVSLLEQYNILNFIVRTFSIFSVKYSGCALLQYFGVLTRAQYVGIRCSLLSCACSQWVWVWLQCSPAVVGITTYLHDSFITTLSLFCNMLLCYVRIKSYVSHCESQCSLTYDLSSHSTD